MPGGYAVTRPAPPPGVPGTMRQPHRSRRCLPACPSRHDRGRDLLLVAALLADTAPCDLAPARDPLGDERRPALGARFTEWPRPERELAVRIVRAREKGLAAAGPALDELSVAASLRTRDTERQWLGRLALRVARTGDELAESPVLDDHRLAARRAHLVRRLVGRLFPSAAQILRVLALGIGRARQEAPESPEFLHEGLPAIRAGLASLEPDLDIVHRLARA